MSSSPLVKVLDKEFQLYISRQEIADIIGRLAGEISNDLRDLQPLVCPVLSGSFIFAADLVRALDFDPEISFVKYSSYEGTSSTGKVAEQLSLSFSQNVIIYQF